MYKIPLCFAVHLGAGAPKTYLESRLKSLLQKFEEFTAYHAIEAMIDTILYQRLIFRSTGNLAREQVYPVALVLWQLLRVCCLASSHLSTTAL